MSYLVPSEFVTKMVDAGESKIFMSTRDTLIRGLHGGGTSAEIAQAMHTNLPRIGMDVSIEGAMSAMQQAGLRAVPVLDADGRVAGLLTLDNVMDALLLAEAAPGTGR